MRSTNLPDPQMAAAEVIGIIELFEHNQIEVIVDGGWGVDALLGEQTRIHTDLDIALPHRFVPLARALLEARGYHDEPRPDTRECNFVLGDSMGHLVDFHSYTYDSAGNLVFGVPYPLDSLNGMGSIAGYPVRCITPQWLVNFHTGYQFDTNDYQDVCKLCQRFALELPMEYAQFNPQSQSSPEKPEKPG